MKTFGEFFDAVVVWDKDNHSPAGVFLEEWSESVTPEKWQEARRNEFTEKLYLAFVEDIASMFSARLHGICTDTLYSQVMEDGHQFLLALIAIVTDFGLTVNPNAVNVPLSISDALFRSSEQRNSGDTD